MSRTTNKRKYLAGGKSHGLRKELNEAGIGLPCSWRRDMMMGHGDDLKELKIIRKSQGKIRRNYLKRELDKHIEKLIDTDQYYIVS